MQVDVALELPGVTALSLRHCEGARLELWVPHLLKIDLVGTLLDSLLTHCPSLQMFVVSTLILFLGFKLWGLGLRRTLILSHTAGYASLPPCGPMR